MHHPAVIKVSHGAATLRAMKNVFSLWRWWLPLLLFSSDAFAWGLYTHVYFAQLLLWAVPLSDARFRKAVAACPRLVLAGACLPDLALLSERPWGEPFSTTHQWQRARKLLEDAGSDEELALSLGFASHLMVDVIAHNHFVPAHERMWGNVPVLTHAACEWAMDLHVRGQLFVAPGELMRSHRDDLAGYVARHFDCPHAVAKRGVGMLAGAEDLLRFSRLSELSYTVAGKLDPRMLRRFDYYLSETSVRLTHIDRILAGEEPVWDANPDADDPAVRQRIARLTPQQLLHRIPLPQDVFSRA